MSHFDINQIHSTEEAAAAFQNACSMMSDYRNHKEAEFIIETLSCTPYAEDIFKTCLQYSDMSYCIFYASKLWGILIMKKWDTLNGTQQGEYLDYFYKTISFGISNLKSISDFGYSEIELVISTILKRLWKDDPQQISQDFFHRIETPSWRKMKLVESLLLTMKSNNSSDFSLDKQTHLLCLQSFYKTSLLQLVQWIVSVFLSLGETFTEHSSQKQEEILELSLTLFCEVLSWPWPTHPTKTTMKTGMSTDLIDPGVQFESVFIQEAVMIMLEKLYFIRRTNSSLPQHVMAVVTLLGSFAPSSFTSTRVHSQHLHRIVAFGQSIVMKQYIDDYQQQGLSVTVDAVEADTKDKLRALLLLKTLLCTHASDVMIYHASWNEVTQNMYSILNVLYSNLIKVVETPDFIEDCVELMHGYEEVISTAMDIVSYWCDSPDLKATIHVIPKEIYSMSLSTRLRVSSIVLRYSDEAGESVWKELEQRDENEDEWTFEEEQDVIGHIGRLFPGETCDLLAQTFSSLVDKLAIVNNEAEASVYQEQLYWVLIYIRHFISDYDSDETPIAFMEMEGNPDYPLLQFMDVCNGLIIRVLSLTNLTVSSVVQQSLLQYLKRFVLLYLSYRPQLSGDIYTILAIALSTTADENTPFKTAIELLEVLLQQTMVSHVGEVNEKVWNNLFGAFHSFITNQHTQTLFPALADMPAKHWKPLTTAIMSGVLAGDPSSTYQQAFSVYQAVLQQLNDLLTHQDINTVISHYTGLYRIQSLLSILRGLCHLPEIPEQFAPFYNDVVSLLFPLFKLVRLHDELRLLVLKTVKDLAHMLLYMSQEKNEEFISMVFMICKSFCESLPSDGASIRKNSDYFVKCFSFLFNIILETIQNLNSSDDQRIDSQLVSIYLALLPYLTQFTFFPLLMKTVFDTSMMICNRHIRGFEDQGYYSLNEFFSFMIPSLERFDCEFKSMECLYMVYYHYLEVVGQANYPEVGIVSFIQSNPNITESVFTNSYKQIFSPKTGVVTKDGLDTRASNLMLVLIATAAQPIESYLQQMYSSILPREPNLFQGIFNQSSIQGFRERQIRWSYNRSFYVFYRTIQHYSE